MRAAILITSLLLLLVSTVRSQDYKTFTREKLVGLKTEKGKVVIPAAFDALGWSDGKFSVTHQVTGYRENGRWGLISIAGRLVTPAIYDQLIPGAGNSPLIRIQQQGREGCINAEGAIAVPTEYRQVIPDGERVILVTDGPAGIRFGICDLQYRMILTPEWNSIRMVTSELMSVTGPNHRTAFFDKNGIRRTEFDFDSIGYPKGNHIPIISGAYIGLANLDGKIIRYPSFKSAVTVNSGETELTRYDRWTLLNRENKEIRSIEADSLLPLALSLLRAVRGNRQGVVNEQLREVWPLEYDIIQPVAHGLLLAGKNGKLGLARQDGRFVIPPNYLQFKTVGRTMAFSIEQGGRMNWYLYQPSTGTLSQKGYSKIEPVADVFKVSTGRFEGLAAMDGNLLLDCVYEKITDVKGASVGVQFMGKYGIVDRSGSWLLLPQDDAPVLLSENVFLLEHNGNKKLINRTGEVLMETTNELRLNGNVVEEWQKSASTPLGTLKLTDGSPVTTQSDPVLPGTIKAQTSEPEFRASEGLIGFADRGKYGFRDLNGRLRIPNRYDSILPFSSGLAPVKLNGKWGAVDQQDNLVIQPKFESLSIFRDQVAIARLNGKLGIIDRNGFRLEAAFDEFLPASNGKYYIIRSGKHYGLVRADGTLLLEARFEELELTGNDQVLVRDGLYGVITTSGLSVIPIQYSALRYLKESGLYLGRTAGLKETIH